MSQSAVGPRSGVSALAPLAALAATGAVLLGTEVPAAVALWISVGLLAGTGLGTIAGLRQYRRRAALDEHACRQVSSERDQLRATLESIPEALFVTGPDGVQWSNRAGLSLLGVTCVDDLPKGRRVGVQLAMRRPDTAEMLTPDELPTSRALAGETVKEEVLLSPSGSSADVHMRVSAAPIEGPDGARAAVLMCSDLTAGLDDVAFIAKLSDALSTSLDYDETVQTIATMALPRLGDHCSVVVVEKDGSQRLAACAHADPALTPSLERLMRAVLNTPYANEESRFMRVLRERRTVMMAVDPEQAQAGIPQEDIAEYGARFGLQSYLGIPLVARGKVVGVMNFGMSGSGRIHTARHARLGEEVAARAATALEHAWLYRQARELNQVKDEFLSALSHELRTPVMAVLGWTQMLKAGVVDPDRIPCALNTIERNAIAQKRLIEDLLDVSRVVTGRLRLDVRPVDPMAVVAEATSIVQPAAAARDIRIHMLSDPAAGLVLADPQRLQQAIWNLLVNAVKFTPPCGQVHVHVLRVADHVEIVVSDTGQGIAPDVLPHVFDQFRQVHARGKTGAQGLGFGLATVRHIVELHGGEVEAQSPGAGKGSTFRIVLPAAKGPGACQQGDRPATRAPRFTAARQIPPTADLGGVRVLLVEDNLDGREMVTYLLRSRGACVTVAASADEALALFDAEIPDVVLCDMQMTEQDGVMLMEAIRARPAERGGTVPAAVLTSRARAEDRLRSQEAGYQAHLARPVDIFELVETVAELARRPAV